MGFGAGIPCVTYIHMKRSAAEALIANGEAQWIGASENVVSMRPPMREPNREFRQACAIWDIAKEEKHQQCQGGLVNPR